tara:strand:+ start:1573 stop:2607 length:1035 start_codon:yes stop_codon:yes gene_type:complete
MAVFMLAGCTDHNTETSAKPESPVRPAAIQTIARNTMGSMSFNGVVRSAERAELAFRVPGKLVSMEVSEGDKIHKDQVLAKLEQEEFLRAENSASVEFEKTQADYERGAQIYKSTQAIAKSDLEKLKTKRDLASNKLSNARQDLDNTALRAPFNGVIAKKSVSNFRNVNSGQTIYVLHDLEDLEVVVDVPSQLFLSPTGQTKAFAMVENGSGVRLPVVYKSYSSESDSLSQTYRVVLEFTDLNGQNVLPGMNARIYPVADGVVGQAVIQVPVQAIVPTNTGDEFVWLVGKEGAVEKRLVKVGQLLDDQVVVKDGLVAGDQIVVAGVNALAEGMKVRPLKAKEQK